jgi:hypothetical protein
MNTEIKKTKALSEDAIPDILKSIVGKTFSSRLLNIAGRKFHFLEALLFLGNSNWLCGCDCGFYTIVDRRHLLDGTTKSCGCYRDSRSKLKHENHRRAYNIWMNMKRRCYYEKHESYPNYGGRGIKVCERWLDSFANFIQDMGYPNTTDTIERVNVNGNYEPSNCTWISFLEQANNTTRTIVVHYKGKKYSLKQLCNMLGLKYELVQRRITTFKWDIYDAISCPPNTKNPKNERSYTS